VKVVPSAESFSVGWNFWIARSTIVARSSSRASTSLAAVPSVTLTVTVAVSSLAAASRAV